MASSTQTPGNIAFLDRLRLLVSPVFYLSRNTISLAGVILATGIFLAMVVFYAANFYGLGANPYVGIVAYLILPGLFVAGGALAGIDTGNIFIENGRFHGEKIVDVIAGRLNG